MSHWPDQSVTRAVVVIAFGVTGAVTPRVVVLYTASGCQDLKLSASNTTISGPVTAGWPGTGAGKAGAGTTGFVDVLPNWCSAAARWAELGLVHAVVPGFVVPAVLKWGRPHLGGV